MTVDGPERIAVVGVGYVGLPLVLALADAGYDVIGVDGNEQRVRELAAGFDRNGAAGRDRLNRLRHVFRADPTAMRGRTCFVVAVPTPLTAARRPDLDPLRDACAAVAAALQPGSLVIIESTVDPGTTREVCVPLLESSGLRCGAGFTIAYAPERVSPGEQAKNVTGIARVVGGYDEPGRRRAAAIYRRITRAPVHEVSAIEVAELSKMVENAQRDINIAFTNEVAMLCDRLGLSSREVLDASATKWNFHRYVPGLVGGHCIAVDPHYLAHRAGRVGASAQMVTAGRAVNQAMPGYVATRILAHLREGGRPAGSRVGILGLSYKADVSDVRNTGVAEVVHLLAAAHLDVLVHDPVVHHDPVAGEPRTKLVDLDELVNLDALVLAVRHRAFGGLFPTHAGSMMRPGGLIADLTGSLHPVDLPAGVRFWSL